MVFDCDHAFLKQDSLENSIRIEPSEGDGFLKLEYLDTNFLSECVIQINWSIPPGRFDFFGLLYSRIIKRYPNVESASYKEQVLFFRQNELVGSSYSEKHIDVFDTSTTWLNTGHGSGVWNPQNKEVDSIVLRLMFNQFTEKTAFRLYLDNVRLQLSGTASVNEQHKNQLKLYPNPTNHLLQLQSDQPMHSVRCYDAQGRLQKEFPIPSSDTEHSLDVSDLIPGIYLLGIELEDGSRAWGRFVKE
jgi:hypothetical protein